MSHMEQKFPTARWEQQLGHSLRVLYHLIQPIFNGRKIQVGKHKIRRTVYHLFLSLNQTSVLGCHFPNAPTGKSKENLCREWRDGALPTLHVPWLALQPFSQPRLH